MTRWVQKSALLAASLPRVEKTGVGSGRELVEGLTRNERSQPHADPNAHLVLDGPTDRIETALDLIKVGPGEPTYELVTAVPDDRVE